MGFYDKYIVPRIVDLGMRTKDIIAERKKCLEGVEGQVIEVGFGSGLNLPYYPRQVKTVVGVDPSGEGAKLAKKRIAEAPFPVELIPLPGEQIPAPDESFDTAVTTFTLCTIPDPATALSQIRRVLKRQGKFFFVEHGQAEETKIQAWQNRLNGAQNFLFGGCNLNRPIQTLIEQAGFQIETIEKYYAKGPKPMAYLYRGIAVRV